MLFRMSRGAFAASEGAIVLYRFLRLNNVSCLTPPSMKRFSISLLLFGLALPVFADQTKSVEDFRAAAEKTNAVLTIPDWPQSPEAVDTMTKDAIAKANAALDAIGQQDLSKVTFKSTIVALDDLTYEATLAANKAVIITSAYRSSDATAGETRSKFSKILPSRSIIARTFTKR